MTGDGGPATSASLSGTLFVGGDWMGSNVFIASSNRVRMVTQGIIDTVAGTGKCCNHRVSINFNNFIRQARLDTEAMVVLHFLLDSTASHSCVSTEMDQFSFLKAATTLCVCSLL